MEQLILIVCHANPQEPHSTWLPKRNATLPVLLCFSKLGAIVQLADPLVKIAPGQQPLARHAPPVVQHRNFKLLLVLLLADLGFTKTLEMPTTAWLVILAVRLAVRVAPQIVCLVRVRISSRLVYVLLLAQMVSLPTPQIAPLAMPIALLAVLLIALPA
jgi:hypothetical protein